MPNEARPTDEQSSGDTADMYSLLTINDAPIRCGRCDEPILGSGTGTFAVLRSAVRDHYQRCPARLGQEGTVTAGDD